MILGDKDIAIGVNAQGNLTVNPPRATVSLMFANSIVTGLQETDEKNTYPRNP